MTIQLTIRPMTETPTQSGRYPVLHRGSVAGDAFYWCPEDVATNTKLYAGWQQLPDFGPTHWIDTAELAEKLPLEWDSKRFWADRNGFPTNNPPKPVKVAQKKSLFSHIFS